MEPGEHIRNKLNPRADSARGAGRPGYGHISRQNSNSRRYMHPYVHSSMSHSGQERHEATKCPLADEWTKTWHIYTVEYYPAMKKREIMPFAATWIDLGMIILSEINQAEKDKYHKISLNLKYDANEYTFRTETDSQT